VKNPTNNGRVSRVSLHSITRETITLASYRAQVIAARFAVPLETAAILAILYFMEAR
jgi:hypothetical protein